MAKQLLDQLGTEIDEHRAEVLDKLTKLDNKIAALQQAVIFVETKTANLQQTLGQANSKLDQILAQPVPEPTPEPQPEPQPTPTGKLQLLWKGDSAGVWDGKEGSGGTWSNGVLTCDSPATRGGTKRNYPYKLKDFGLPIVVTFDAQINVDYSVLRGGGPWMQLSTVAQDHNGYWDTETISLVDSSGTLYSKKLGTLQGKLARGVWGKFKIYVAPRSNGLSIHIWLDGKKIGSGSWTGIQSYVNAFHFGYYSDQAVSGSVKNKNIAVYDASQITDLSVEPV